MLLTIDGYRNGSMAIDRAADVAAIRSALPSLRSTVVLPYLAQDLSRIPGALPWAELMATNGDLFFEPVPFDHPLYILYSSGTTGLPKPIAHGHGGMLLEHLKALGLHHDLGERDRFFWFSSTGWMMWNYLVSGLAVGASIVCFDGNPTHPDLSALWQFAAETRVTYFGAGAPFFLACRRDGLNPGRQFDLSRLRGVGSTASPLPPEAFRWVYDAVGPHVHLASMPHCGWCRRGACRPRDRLSAGVARVAVRLTRSPRSSDRAGSHRSAGLRFPPGTHHMMQMHYSMLAYLALRTGHALALICGNRPKVAILVHWTRLSGARPTTWARRGALEWDGWVRTVGVRAGLFMDLRR